MRGERERLERLVGEQCAGEAGDGSQRRRSEQHARHNLSMCVCVRALGGGAAGVCDVM